MTESEKTKLAIYRKDNAILTRALEWYANKDNWYEVMDGQEYAHPALADVDVSDPGGKARRALERARKVKA